MDSSNFFLMGIYTYKGLQLKTTFSRNSYRVAQTAYVRYLNRTQNAGH